MINTELLDVETKRAGGKYSERALLKAIKAAIEASKAEKKTKGYNLDEFLKEVFVGNSRPNLGALRKKISETCLKNNLGNPKVSISEKSNTIGFFAEK